MLLFISLHDVKCQTKLQCEIQIVIEHKSYLTFEKVEKKEKGITSIV